MIRPGGGGRIIIHDYRTDILVAADTPLAPVPEPAVRHAIYLFTHQAILALYAMCSERIPTPALLASEGGLLSFMRVDFDRLLEQSDRIT